MTARALTAKHRARVLLAAAQLLGYPDDDLAAREPLLRAVTSATPAPAAGHLAAACDGVLGVPLEDAQRRYVETFDLDRRCCPYLTYYSYGDTRKRGMALLRFTHAYKAGGFEVADGELPDHLGVVCEFAAAAPEQGLRLFAEHRAGLELLRLALADRRSPYVDVIDAIRAVLPDPAPRDLDRAVELARTGPPAEEVGLEPFEPPMSTLGARR